MSTRATSTFTVTGWEAAPYDVPPIGPTLSRVTISKAFEGDLVGESMGEGLFCWLDDPEAGSGYVVSERVTGQLGGRIGTFVIQHNGIMGPGIAPRTFGHVVPGSGTDALAGLTGTLEIQVEGEVHTLILEYDFT